MKKVLSILLIVLLTISSVAFAATGDVAYTTAGGQMEKYGLEEYTNFNSWCALGDTIYIATYDGTIVTQKVGQAEPKVYTTDFAKNEEENTYVSVTLFSSSEKVYMLKTATHYGGGDDNNYTYTTQSGLYELSFTDAEATANFLYDLDMTALCSSDGYYNVQYVMGAGNYVVFYTGSDDDSSSAGVWAMNIADGSFRYIEIPTTISYPYPMYLTPYLNGTILTQMWANEEYSAVNFYVIDPAAGTCTVLSTVSVGDYNSFNGIAVDPQTGTAYCVDTGEIHTLDLTTGAIGDAITDIMADSTSNGVILNGGYYAIVDYESYSLRNIASDQQSTRKLKVISQTYSTAADAAYYAFTNAHGDVSVVYAHDYNAFSNLIENMMNRDASVDVYIMYTSSEAFAALFDRGYLADFTDSEKMMAFAQRLDPTFLEKLSVNGRFSVLPVETNFYSMPFLHKAAFEKAGISMDEVPTNWMDFIAWLPTLEGRLPEGVTLLDPWTSDEQARVGLFYVIFQSYQTYLNQDANSVSTQDMVSILDALSKIDFTKLGQPTEDEMMGNYDADWNDDNILMEINGGYALDGITRSNTPLVMSLTANVDPVLEIDSVVAVINPFSENIDLALEYIETISENLEENVYYTICTDKTEPVLNKYYESNIASLQEYIDDLKKELETAEEVDKQDIEESIKANEESLKEYEKYRYSINEEDIAWIGAHRSELTLSGDNWLYSSESGDAWDLVQQYLQGQIDASRLMKEIDRKVRMRILEGA